MKNNTPFSVLKVFALCLLVIFTFTNCERETNGIEQKGKIGFSFSSDLSSALKSADIEDSTVYTRLSLLISVVNSDSLMVMDKKLIPLYAFGDQFVSEKIELEEGFYFLTEFMVVNASGDVLLATPKRGAKLAYLVDSPLPIDFKIRSGVESDLSVEVLAVKNQSPSDFGYISFGINIIRPLTFYAFVYNDNPLFYGPLTPLPARVVITDPNGKLYRFDFKADVNKVIIRAMAGRYEFQIKTDTYFETYVYTLQQLRESTKDNPLKIPVGNPNTYHELIIQTSPDATDDALITDLNPNENYGDTKEFAASFLTEPVLTVMRTKRSLIRFDFDNALPKSATIQKIELSLSLLGGVQMPFDGGMDSMYFGVLKAIVEPWEEYKVTWDNQPKTIDDVMMYLDFRPWMSTIIRTYDITDLIKKSWTINTPVYGFMLQHYPEDMPGGVSFASSDAENPEMRPRLKIYYTLP